MSDLISREAVLKHIEKTRQAVQMMDDTRRASIIMNGMYLCEKAVRNQPSAQPEKLTEEILNDAHNEGYDVGYWAGRRDYEQRWVPCSERPPEKDGRYQVTRHDYVTNTEFIDILWYEKNLWWNGHSMGDYAVTAWMPLPEPYKEEQE